jgi:hypothetical protein
MVMEQAHPGAGNLRAILWTRWCRLSAPRCLVPECGGSSRSIGCQAGESQQKGKDRFAMTRDVDLAHRQPRDNASSGSDHAASAQFERWSTFR